MLMLKTFKNGKLIRIEINASDIIIKTYLRQKHNGG